MRDKERLSAQSLRYSIQLVRRTKGNRRNLFDSSLRRDNVTTAIKDTVRQHVMYVHASENSNLLLYRTCSNYSASKK